MKLPAVPLPRRRLLALGLIAASLGGCAGLTTSRPNQPARDSLRHFSLEARFALRVEAPYSDPESASGRLSWEHRADADRILIATPLGQGLANIERDPTGARLQTSDGRLHQAADAGELVRATLGYELPITELPGWFIGHPAPGGTLKRDPLGRPLNLDEPGWHIDYSYDDEAADAPPSRLTIRREADATLRHLELRLRIEEWQVLP